MARSTPQLATGWASLYRLNLTFVQPQHPSPEGTDPHSQPPFAVTFSGLFQWILEDLFERWVIVTHILGLCISMRTRPLNG